MSHRPRSKEVRPVQTIDPKAQHAAREAKAEAEAPAEAPTEEAKAPEPEAKPKAERKPISAAKAAKAIPAAPKAVVPESRKGKDGKPVRCTVVMKSGEQCANPARWEHKPGWTCSTHDRAFRRGKKLNLGGRKTLPYEAPSLGAQA